MPELSEAMPVQGQQLPVRGQSQVREALKLPSDLGNTPLRQRLHHIGKPCNRGSARSVGQERHFC